MSNSLVIQKIYTDGACSGNPGPGGWGVVAYLSDGSRHELGGAEGQTTNNRMEMQAAIAALEFLSSHGNGVAIELYTDSEYVKNGVTKWVSGWKKKGWKTAAGKAVLNQDLWQQLDQLNSTAVKWCYVRGHSGDEGNERCDAIARAYSLGKSPALAQRQFSAPSPAAALRQAADPSLVTEIASPDSHSLNNNAETGAVQSNFIALDSPPDLTMPDAHAPLTETLDNIPREVKVAQLRDVVETLRIADEIAAKGYLITSSELADLMDINASAVTSRGDNWVWRNWIISRARREGNQILWQLERVD